jgi:U3 small nucleolar RNA-associated protein 22
LDALTKQLRALNDLALKVIGVQPLSSVTRHTCCFYPEPHPLDEGAGARAYTPGAKVPRVLETIDVMVQLESTGVGEWFTV